MRQLIAAMVLMLVGVLPVLGQGEPATGVQAVIASQVEAFAADDLETAFSFASPEIRRMFGNPDQFGQMVQQGFPMVWRPSDYVFHRLRREAGWFYQTVLFTDAAGRRHWLVYQLSDRDDGWHIYSVRFIQAPGVGA